MLSAIRSLTQMLGSRVDGHSRPTPFRGKIARNRQSSIGARLALVLLCDRAT
jgi:hypothetical protein